MEEKQDAFTSAKETHLVFFKDNYFKVPLKGVGVGGFYDFLKHCDNIGELGPLRAGSSPICRLTTVPLCSYI